MPAYRDCPNSKLKGGDPVSLLLSIACVCSDGEFRSCSRCRGACKRCPTHSLRITAVSKE